MATEKTSPEQLILVNDVELPPEMRIDVLETVVSQHVDGGDAFEIRFNALDSTNQGFKWIGSDELQPGNKVEVRFGYQGNLAPVIVGEITALEGQFPSDGPALLLVQGFDRLHRFRRGRQTRVFTSIKDSQLAEEIASDLGLGAEVVDSELVHDYLLQNNLSNLDFLLERARRIRFEVLVDDQTLRFRKAANDLGEVATLEYMVDLMSFSARLSTADQVSEISVRGWDPAKKEALLGVAQAGDETTRMDGSSIGAEIASAAFQDFGMSIVDIPVYSQAEADQMAKAKFNDMSMALIRGSAKAVGRAYLTAGSTVALAGLGDRFSGLYYVTKSEHRLSTEDGYVTWMTVERSGW